MEKRPLTRSSVDLPLRILLPLLAAFSWFIAYSWATVSPEELTASIVLRVLDATPSLHIWAAAVGVGAAMMTVALVAHLRPLFTYALAVTCGVYMLMSIIAAVAAVHGATSSSAWAWSAFVAAVSAACIWGLNSREG